jgi:hypothetical protein
MTLSTGRNSLDAILRSGSAVLSVSGDASEGVDLTLVGQVTGVEEEPIASPVRLVVEADAVAGLEVPETEGALAFFAQGELLPYRVTDYSRTWVLGGRYETHSGTFEDTETGTRFDFIAASDPVHIPIIGGLLVIASCPLMAGASFLAEWVQSRTSGWRSACIAAGGFPFVVTEFSLRARGWRLNVECVARARVECRNLDGTLINANYTEFQPLRG